jgi:DamX protein
MVERTLISFPSQLQLIDRLQHLLYLSSSITFISGEAGSGKSTLVEQLSNLLPDDTQQAFISLSQPTSAPQLRQQIIAQLFDQPLFNAEDSLSNILLLLKESQKKDVSRAVVIDNAGLLPVQLLAELAEVIDQRSYFTDHEFSFILLSDDSKTSQMVRSIKQLPNHLNVATLTFKLAPLSDNEAKQLLNHRFEQIGYAPQVEHQDALALQLARCQGIPEKILTLATKVSSGELNNNKLSWLKTGLPAVLIMLVLIIIAGSLAYYLYPKFIKTDEIPEIIIETEMVLPENIQATELITDSLSDAQSTEALAGNWKAGSLSVTDNQLAVGKEDSQDRDIISEQQILQLSSSEASKTMIQTNGMELSDLSTSSASSTADFVTDKATISSESKVLSESELIVASEAQKSEAVAQSATLSNANEKLNSENPKEIPLSKEPVIVKPESEGLFTPSDILLSVNPNVYTLQLAGFGSEQSLKRFIGQHNLPREDVYLYQTIRNTKPWYVAIYGQFENRETATAKAQNLPDTLVNLKSWAKKFALVHQDLQRDE